MISNILILLILIYLAMRLLALIVLILRRLNRNRSLTQIESPRNLFAILFSLPSGREAANFVKLE